MNRAVIFQVEYLRQHRSGLDLLNPGLVRPNPRDTRAGYMKVTDIQGDEVATVNLDIKPVML